MTTATKTTTTLTPAEAVSVARELHRLRKESAARKKQEEGLTASLKRYLESSGEPVYDGEFGLTAKLQTRNGSPTYDVKSMPDSLVMSLRDLAALNVDSKVIKALDGRVIESLDVKRFAMPGSTSTSIAFEEDK